MNDSIMDLEPVIAAPARRGRPRKDSPVVHDGVELLSGEERLAHLQDVEAMRRSMEAIRSAGQELVRTLHSIGERIHTMDMRCGRKNLSAAEHMRLLGLSEVEFRAATKVYRSACENPAAMEEAEGLTLTSLRKVMAHFRDPSRKEPAPQVVFPQRPVSWSDVERLPQAAGGRLRHYRIRAEPTDGNFYVYHNDDVPVPIVSLEVDLPRNFQQETAFEKMRDKIQVALEEYYAIIEETEEDWT